MCQATAGALQGLVPIQPGLDPMGCLSVVNVLFPVLVVLSALRGGALPRGKIDERFIPIEPFATDRLFEDFQRHLPQTVASSAPVTPGNQMAESGPAPQSDLPPLDRPRRYRRTGWLTVIAIFEIALVVLLIRGWQGDAPLQTLKIGSWVAGVAFSPDGQSLAVATDGWSVQWWRLSDYTLSQTEPLTRSLTSFALARDGQTMAAGSDQGTVALWQAGGTLVHVLNEHTVRVNE